jgi:Fur family transcriptional regulator, ferric uptake regulator
MSTTVDLPAPWSAVPGRFRARGMRWTPQRRSVIEVLASTAGHITGAELVERCRARDPQTIPSTVYRTLDVLEELGLVRHGHRADGREEFHVGPGTDHGHMYCAGCGGSWQIPDRAAHLIAGALAEADGFDVDVSHVTVVGRCRQCAVAGGA